MRIEITEKGSEAFYRESVNIAAQYRFILKDHSYKVRDYFRQFRFLLIAGVTVLALFLLTILLWGGDSSDFTVVAVLFIVMVLCAAYVYSLNKILKGLMSDGRTSVLTLDEKGVELNKEDSQTVRIGWDNIAVVRVCSEGLYFVSADQTGIVISVYRRYENEIKAWMREHRPETEML